MKRYLPLLLLFLSSVLHADPPKLSWGVKAGTNFNRVCRIAYNEYGGYQDGYRIKTGFYAGGLVEYRVKPAFALLGELYFSRQWAGIFQSSITLIQGDNDLLDLNKGIISISNSSIISTIDYLYLPLGARIYPLRWLSAEGGVQIGYKINVTDREMYPVDLESSGNKAFNKPFDCDLFAGISFHVTPHIAINGRYFMGLANFMNNTWQVIPEASQYGGTQVTYSVFQTGIEVKF